MMARGPVNGYVVYPSSTGYMGLRQAKAAAKRESKREGYARVENVDTGKTVAEYRYGQSNPVRRRKRANGRRRARKLMASGSKKLAAWVRSQSNRKRRKNPVRVGATVVGKGTGWIRSRATRVLKKNGKYVVEIKR